MKDAISTAGAKDPASADKIGGVRNPTPTKNPAIVVCAYNRPVALQRLLRSLQTANYPPDRPVTLHISIDHGETQAVREVVEAAQGFDWPHGQKVVAPQAKHLGLLNHFYASGELACRYGSIILLEDDLIAAAPFYEFAWQALDAYREDARIAGISLYSLWFNGYTQHAFTPLPDDSDIFFLQVPYTQGQAFTQSQWEGFKQWQAAGQHLSGPLPGLHELFLHFDAEDWFPMRMRYLVDSGRYYVFPRQSLTSGAGDAGTHFKQPSYYFQVPLQNYKRDYRFQSFDDAPAVYDAFYEILPERLKRLSPALQGYDFSVDLNGSKARHNLGGKFVLTSRPARKACQQYGRSMWPAEANLIHEVPGDEIRLSAVEDLLWGRLADLAVRKANYDYTTRHHPMGKKALIQFTLLGWLQRFGIIP
jgi:hypothetical protein